MIPRVLVACEYSGVVRDAFIRSGCEALSCDLEPTEAPGPHHQGDVRALLRQRWDLVVAHPPCTYLCSSGLHWNKRVPGRDLLTKDALQFVRLFLYGIPHIPHICVENPIGCISTQVRRPDQIIQPWQFGHPESKATCLWLIGLPKLVPTKVLPLPACGHWDNQTASGQNRLPPSDHRARDRSRTYQGIGEAMAAQWSPLLKESKQ